jgi:hypothetical protein
MRELDLTVATIYTQLLQQGLDAEFEADFAENGSFSARTIKGRRYWYYNGYDKLTGGKYQKYVGPADDPGISGRVERFQSLKSDFRTRRQLVSALRGAGASAPEPFVAEVVNVLRKAGVFRLRCVLVGTVAYQCYGPMLGVILRTRISRSTTAFPSGSARMSNWRRSRPPYAAWTRRFTRWHTGTTRRASSLSPTRPASRSSS